MQRKRRSGHSERLARGGSKTNPLPFIVGGLAVVAVIGYLVAQNTGDRGWANSLPDPYRDEEGWLDAVSMRMAEEQYVAARKYAGEMGGRRDSSEVERAAFVKLRASIRERLKENLRQVKQNARSEDDAREDFRRMMGE